MHEGEELARSLIVRLNHFYQDDKIPRLAPDGTRLRGILSQLCEADKDLGGSPCPLFISGTFKSLT